MSSTAYNRELAPYASDHTQTKGRIIDETDCPMRNPFQRDRDRIIHTAAFRRLKYKTQVFVYHEGDNYRTRLTHSIEVAQIARTLARLLNLHEDLAEAIALAHDLGHPPFGHTGEDALHECMKDYGGFDHNDQCIRVITQLERRYAAFDGLNLSWETLEGIAKHNGPVPDTSSMPTIETLNQKIDLRLDTYASAEAQVAAVADDIAYNNHDLDDGLRAGLFTMQDLSKLPLISDLVEEIEDKYPNVETQKKSFELTRQLMSIMIKDIIDTAERRISDVQPQSVEDIRLADDAVVRFSRDFDQSVLKPLRAFLMENMYRHYKINRIRKKAVRVVQDIFHSLCDYPQALSYDWQEEIVKLGGTVEGTSPEDRAIHARVVMDFVAGMTDRYALRTHAKLFDPYLEQKSGHPK